MTKIICVETGRVFNTITEAAAFIGVTPLSISIHLRGDSKTSGGYHWRYANQEPSPSDPVKTKRRSGMSIDEVQEEARRRSIQTGKYIRYADIQKEETLRLMQAQNKRGVGK